MMDKTTTTESGNKEKVPSEQVVDKVAGISPGLARLRQKLGEKARNEPKFRFYSLYAHVYHIETLRTAWRLIRQHGQTPGIDNLTYSDIENNDGEVDPKKVEDYLKGIHEELKARTYKPMPVRRVYIPKADGRKRPLGIPTIKDRIVQMAVLLIIEPIFEEDFLECSYGFRPNRSAHEAIIEIAKNFKEGRTAVYDADLKGYFDSIPHEQLLACIRMRVTDGMVLRLLTMWLKAPIVEKEKDDNDNWKITVSKPTKGTPQGGVISPLLANVYLHWFDKKFHAKDGPYKFADARLVRYADDFVVMAKDVGDKISNSIKYLIEDWMRLEINKEKTKTITLSQLGDSIDFLGFTFRVERSPYKGAKHYIRIEPKKKAVEKAMATIRKRTARSLCHLPVDALIGDINAFLEGWGSYFRLGHPYRVFKKVNEYVYRKVERHLKKRSQRGYRKPDNLSWYAYLKELGLVSLRR